MDNELKQYLEARHRRSLRRMRSSSRAGSAPRSSISSSSTCSGTWQHVSLLDQRLRRVGVRGGPRLRRLVDQGLAGDRRSRTCCSCPTRRPRSSIPSPRSRRSRSSARSRDPVTGGPYDKDPRFVAQQGRGVPALDRRRRHRLLRARVRVLRLRLGRVRHRAAAHRLLRSTPSEAHWNSRQARARLHDPREGGLLPARAARHAAGPALRDGADARAGSASPASSTTTRSRPAASARSTCASTSLARWPTR